MKQKIINVVSAQTNYAQAQEEFQILESSYPSMPEFYQTALIFSSISKETNTPIKELRYDLTSSQKNISYNVDITAVGSYQNFLDMINQINQGRRLMDINTVTMNQLNNSLNLSLSANLVYLPNNK